MNANGTATTTGNSVIMNNGTVTRNVLGGYSHVSGSGTATSTGNSVIMNNGTVTGYVYGGYSSGSGTAMSTGNSVIISGGSVGGDVLGGYSSVSASGTATSTGNSVIISGGSVGGDVLGGYSHVSGSGTATSTGNSVTISNKPNLSASTLYGGDGSGTVQDYSGNTLNVWNYTGGSISGAQNFQYYNFVLPGTMGHGGTALEATDTVVLSGSGKDSTVSLNMLGGGTAMRAGDTVTLIRAASLTGDVANTSSLGLKGVSLLYDFQLAKAGNNLIATVVGEPRVNPQVKALAEGRAASVAFTSQGADLVAGAGLGAALEAVRGAGAGAQGGKSGDGTGGKLASFSAFQGGSSRYKTGSHVDVDGFSLLSGLGWNSRIAYGDLLLGAFFEVGSGTYDTYNSFGNLATIKGSGDTRYTGGGLLGRLDIPLGGEAGVPAVYVEASVRAGWAETEFASSDLQDGLGRDAEYESAAMYYGAHLGLGAVWNLTDAMNLDVYTKYFWTRQESDSVSVVGDPVHFKATDSHRWRGGARLGYDVLTESGTRFTPYLGVAYEHEFDGKAEATTYGRAIDAPDLKGGTGIGELGFSITPGGEHGVSFDLGVQGYTGLREGVTGSVRMTLLF